MEDKNTRIVYLDYMRIIAVFSVVLLHVSAGQWAFTDVYSAKWQALNLYDGLTRWCVPVLFMISGALFLDDTRPVTLGIMFSKYIPRIILTFFFWSALYALTDQKGDFFHHLFAGHYHLWFLYVIVGLYLVVPILRVYIKNASWENLTYYLILSFVFAILLRTLVNVKTFEPLSEYVSKLNLHLVMGYTGYFVAGYYFSAYKAGCGTLFWGGIGALATVLGTGYFSQLQGSAVSLLYSYLSPNVAFMSAGVFVLVKCIFEKAKQRLWVRTVADCSFGIYLVHDFFNILFAKYGIHVGLFSAYYSVPVLAIAIFSFSLITVLILRKIPLVRLFL